MLISANDKATGKGVTIYTGDDADEANKSAALESTKPENVGKYLRFYDFTFLGGGMNTPARIVIAEETQAQIH